MSHCLFFFGRLGVGKIHPDPDARIGYCAAKKLAFVGYRASVVLAEKTMVILDFLITEANVPDCHSGHTLLVTMKEHGTLRLVGILYGDNAYDTAANQTFLVNHEVHPNFHNKSETGKTPMHKHSARRKSRIRSKVESLFGILTGNYAFNRLRVRRLAASNIYLSLVFTAWNFFILMSWFVDKFEYRISIKELLGAKPLKSGGKFI
jgi:hypothetical protein